jgi:hypothetical protein
MREPIFQDLKEILKNAASDLEKLDIIFKFVQHKMNWNNQNGYYTDKGVIKPISIEREMWPNKFYPNRHVKVCRNKCQSVLIVR